MDATNDRALPARMLPTPKGSAGRPRNHTRRRTSQFTRQRGWSWLNGCDAEEAGRYGGSAKLRRHAKSD